MHHIILISYHASLINIHEYTSIPSPSPYPPGTPHSLPGSNPPSLQPSPPPTYYTLPLSCLTHPNLDLGCITDITTKVNLNIVHPMHHNLIICKLTSPKKIWAALHHFWQKLQFSDFIFIIKILIVN